MPSRSRRSNHCDDCTLFRPLCVCGTAAQVRKELEGIRTQVIILMHVRELTLPTNTARLATSALKDSEIRLRGGLDQPMATDDLVGPERQSLLLYPSDEAIELSPQSLRQWDRPIRLIVPDGSWRQARKVAGREKALQGVPQVKLPPGPPSRYRLRKEPNERSVSTFEAIARALGVIEGPAAQSKLEELFEMRVERTLWSRGLLTESQCRFGIPAETYAAFYEAGCRGGEKAKLLLQQQRRARAPWKTTS